MTNYSQLLKAYLDRDENTQSALADRIGKSQAAVNRYVNSIRFPDSATARRIDEATGGEVSFAAWQDEMAHRLGLDTDQSSPFPRRATA